MTRGLDADAGRDGDGDPTIILMPDQRVRVFVSSTMEELAAERTAVRRAIEALHLSPILFELGARSHPPRSLYRSYLDQSHVFLGIYWERYGWVAPGMRVSGLEDEYVLSGSRPKLVYVKRPAPDREDRLSDLLGRVRDSDEVSYKGFATADELERLVGDDLALLLAEAFLVEPGAEHRQMATTPLPADTTTFVGREAELTQLRELIGREDVRLVTLTGPGGIGKTRLALRLAAAAASAFGEGAAFVPLASVRDARMVPSAVATAVGLVGTGAEVTLDVLKADLAARSLLLVVDNCEQVIGAADLLAELLGAAPGLKVLATSREALRLRGEYEFEVPPLAAGDGVRLFDERAGAVRRDFRIDETNAELVARICRRLEGVPLAIELAAAHARLLPLKAMLERLDHRLDFLAGGARDLPERQQAMRTTLQWSYDLLDGDERRLFAELGVFVGSFSLAAVEAVGTTGGRDVLDLLGSLVDKSLLRTEATADEPRFRMLEMIREFARERLDERDDAEDVGARHAAFFREFSVELEAGVRGIEQSRWLETLGREGEGEADNLRAAISWFLARHRLDEFTEIAWALWVPAWINGRIGEGRRLTRAALAADGELSELSRARLSTMAGLFAMWAGDHDEAAEVLPDAVAQGRALHDDEIVAYALVGWSMIAPAAGEVSAEELAGEGVALCRRLGDRWGEAAALNALSWLHVARGRFEESGPLFDETLASALAVGDEFFIAMAEVNLAEYYLDRDEVDRATDLLGSCARRHQSVHLLYSVGYMLDAVARLALQQGDAARAATLLGAATDLRASIGVSVWGTQLERRNELTEAVQTVLGEDEFAPAFANGGDLSYSDAVEVAAG